MRRDALGLSATLIFFGVILLSDMMFQKADMTAEMQILTENLTQARDSVEALRAVREQLMESDSVLNAAYADSVSSWAQTRARHRQQVVAQSRVYEDVIDSLKAAVSPETTALVTVLENTVEEMSAQRDSIEASKDAQIADLYALVISRDAIIEAQIEELSALEVRYNVQNDLNTALRKQMRSLNRHKWIGFSVAAVSVGVALIK